MRHLGRSDCDFFAQFDVVAQLVDGDLPFANLIGGDVAGMQQPTRKGAPSCARRSDAQQLVERSFPEDIEISGERMVIVDRDSLIDPLPMPLASEPLDAALAESRSGIRAAATRDCAVVRDHEREKSEDRDEDPRAEVNDDDDRGSEEEHDARNRHGSLACAERGSLGAMGGQAVGVDGAWVGHAAEYGSKEQMDEWANVAPPGRRLDRWQLVGD